jgi:hypothetical protein
MAERSRDLRLELLEDVVEQMTTILIDFCDEVLKNNVAAKDPDLLACLQRSSARVIALAKTVHPEETVETTVTLQVPSSHSPGTGHSIESGVQDTSECRDERCRSEHADDKAPVSSNENPPATSMMDGIASPGWSVCLAEMIQSDNPDGYNCDTNGRSNLDLRATQLLPPRIQSPPRVVPFPLRLVKTTIGQAYLFLRGDLYVSSEDIDRSFGNTLRLRTREQLISRMHWLLGRSINDLSEAAGMTGAHTQLGSSETPPSGLGTSSNVATAWDLDTDGILKWPYSEMQADAFLTAFGVYRELGHLGARMLDPDTMEISITGVGLSTSHHSSEGGLSGTNPYNGNYRNDDPTYLTVRLNVSRLARSLTSVAVCLARGPVYPRHELAKAVEASVILVKGGETAC